MHPIAWTLDYTNWTTHLLRSDGLSTFLDVIRIFLIKFLEPCRYRAFPLGVTGWPKFILLWVDMWCLVSERKKKNIRNLSSLLCGRYAPGPYLLFCCYFLSFFSFFYPSSFFFFFFETGFSLYCGWTWIPYVVYAGFELRTGSTATQRNPVSNPPPKKKFFLFYFFGDKNYCCGLLDLK